MRPRTDSHSGISDLPSRLGEDEGYFEVVEITAERTDDYEVRCKGIDPETMEPWPQSWIAKSDFHSSDLIKAWERKQAKGNNSTTSKQSQRLVASTGTPELARAEMVNSSVNQFSKNANKRRRISTGTLSTHQGGEKVERKQTLVTMDDEKDALLDDYCSADNFGAGPHNDNPERMKGRNKGALVHCSEEEGDSSGGVARNSIVRQTAPSGLSPGALQRSAISDAEVVGTNERPVKGKNGRRQEGKVVTSEELDTLFQSIKSSQSAELAILHLIHEYDFSEYSLRTLIQKEGLTVSFSKVKYAEIAPFVGLDPIRNLNDIGTFELYRSRISTSLFKAIVNDMDMMSMSYGPLFHHKTEYATYHFFAPIFSQLTAQFGFAFRNLPESTIEGRITTSGRMEYYFKSFGAISIVFMEIKLKGDLDAIAQVIAESDACDWNNSLQNISVPVIGILWDGTCFRFFRFDGSTKPYKFLRGTLPGDPPFLQQGFVLPNYTTSQTTFPFLQSLRQITEILFDLLLCSYISSIEVLQDRSAARSDERNKWEDAHTFARKALQCFRDAESKREIQADSMDELVLKAQNLLKQSVEAIPERDSKNTLIMSGWKDEINFV